MSRIENEYARIAIVVSHAIADECAEMGNVYTLKEIEQEALNALCDGCADDVFGYLYTWLTDSDADMPETRKALETLLLIVSETCLQENGISRSEMFE